MSQCQFRFPCPHETSRMNHPPNNSDYHALSKKQIGCLLEIAQKSAGVEVVSDIQVRLVQGIVGITCPYQEAHMPQLNKISELYMGFINGNGVSSESLADELHAVMR